MGRKESNERSRRLPETPLITMFVSAESFITGHLRRSCLNVSRPLPEHRVQPEPAPAAAAAFDLAIGLGIAGRSRESECRRQRPRVPGGRSCSSRAMLLEMQRAQIEHAGAFARVAIQHRQRGRGAAVVETDVKVGWIRQLRGMRRIKSAPRIPPGAEARRRKPPAEKRRWRSTSCSRHTSGVRWYSRRPAAQRWAAGRGR